MDRNFDTMQIVIVVMVALRKESVDRNFDTMQIVIVVMKSLSARRAWIEIIDDFEPSSTRKVALRKESVDRNSLFCGCCARFRWSLSARRAWIEIASILPSKSGLQRRSPQGERG